MEVIVPKISTKYRFISSPIPSILYRPSQVGGADHLRLQHSDQHLEVLRAAARRVHGESARPGQRHIRPQVGGGWDQHEKSYFDFPSP